MTKLYSRVHQSTKGSHLFAAVVIDVVAIKLAVIGLELIADLETYNDQTVYIANGLTLLYILEVQTPALLVCACKLLFIFIFFGFVTALKVDYS